MVASNYWRADLQHSDGRAVSIRVSWIHMADISFHSGNYNLADLPTKYGGYGYHGPEIVETILTYLQECYQKISAYDAEEKNQVELTHIRQNYFRFAKEQRFASLEFFKVIEDYRPKIIDRANISI